MQVILKEDVLNLGYKDDVVTVKDGYGRNYLIPQGKAVIATPSALKMLAENMKQRAHKLEKIKNDAKEYSIQSSLNFSYLNFFFDLIGNLSNGLCLTNQKRSINCSFLFHI